MAKKTKKEVKKELYEDRKDLKKLSLFVTIVSQGQAGPIIKIFQDAHSSAQFVQMGTGTAGKQVMDILGITDNRKEVVLCLVKKDSIPAIKVEIEAFFAASRKNRGVGFSIPMASIIGVRMYQFLADAL